MERLSEQSPGNFRFTRFDFQIQTPEKLKMTLDTALICTVLGFGGFVLSVRLGMAMERIINPIKKTYKVNLCPECHREFFGTEQ